MNINKLFLAILCVVCLCLPAKLFAQDDVNAMRNFQMSFTRVSQACTQYNDTLKKIFEKKGLKFPNADIFLRSFKGSNEMELWARAEKADTFMLVKTYKVCALSGSLGPKRWEGDKMVPEGMYFIEDFNPKSDFYLSMLINYPNYSDLIFSDKNKPGGDIYIHGGCVTVGCLPMTDNGIKELYVLCLSSRLAGQTYIPVHIYPTRFDRNGLNFLGREYGTDQEKQKFWINLKKEYDYFEKTKRLLPVMYTPEGKYIF
jgi:murein L,D-transpeptidase YafK